jgi:hypothetical protein
MNRLIVSLFDESGNMVLPWAEHGFICYCFDLLNDDRVEHFPSGGRITFVQGDLAEEATLNYIRGLQPCLILSFPPCTDLAVSGAKHFSDKLDRNPFKQEQATHLARTAERLGAELGAAWTVENPVSVLSTLWKQPTFAFDPSDYGGYLPSNDVHPRYPKYIAPRDAYPKKTCIWLSEGLSRPVPMPVRQEAGLSRQTKLLGGNSLKTKRIRAETPRGFATAFFVVNWRRFW